MKMKIFGLYGIAVALAAVFLTSGNVMAAQIISKTADVSTAFRIKNGYTGTFTYVVGSDTSVSTNVLTCDGNANTRIFTNGADTIKTLQTYILTCTNVAGESSLTLNTEPSLAADTMGLLAGTYTALAGEWVDILWDTSVCLHYDLYLASRTYYTGVSAYILDKVVGEPTGTGDMTASIYQDGTLIARKVITSPVYVNPETWIDNSAGSTNTFTTDANVNLNWEVDMPFSGKDAVIIRAARATTATTGVLSAVVPNP